MPTLEHYKCPNCGGTLEFDSQSQQMKCPFCDTIVPLEEAKAQAEQADLENAAAPEGSPDLEEGGQEFSKTEADAMQTYVCPSCGGEIVVEKSVGAASCPFCGNAQVMPKTFEGVLKPDFIIPFKLDARAVKEHYRAHLTGKHFLPAIFRDENHIDEVRGIYVPFWLFDSRVHANLSFRCEKIRHREDSRYRYTEHHFYNVYRRGTLDFQNVPVDGSKVMPDELMESIEPFNPEEKVEYSSAYMSGYAANKYDVEQQDCVDHAHERMGESTVAEIERTVTGYDRVSRKSCQLDYRRNKAKYVLYPVWLLNTTWRGTRYSFAMNGQTGKFVGNLPMDKAAFWKTFALLSFCIGTVLFLLVLFLQVKDGGGVYY